MKPGNQHHANLVRKFYTAFSLGDWESMVACYHPGIVFHDPAFGTLYGEEARNMWKVLIERSKGSIRVTYHDIEANDLTGSARWSAEYAYSATGRTVINHVSAFFEFADDKIIRHNDHFNMWRWTQQALGWKGYLLGWTPFMKNLIQKRARQLVVQKDRS